MTRILAIVFILIIGGMWYSSYEKSRQELEARVAFLEKELKAAMSSPNSTPYKSRLEEPARVSGRTWDSPTSLNYGPYHRR